ncbi:hypothetical protein G3N56_07730 [Desulfovibrio sulfodismutans]|uniref:Uncharacterized protein n=1 Tax=Desulfolutivibrio sulfodismutans TaxID=63561 RepID=A0A7K3NKA1_9BACT|nr:hypothetical protein [Desulfolutivibrio sulfodismutans]NDY56631.1 hypothetical protein [Desulfolutivibrio sulfodismutans]QLA11268.1 hypothetical protein GD606_02725 [Desulfolutivibrio sulfodismutans DSM 3696]
MDRIVVTHSYDGEIAVDFENAVEKEYPDADVKFVRRDVGEVYVDPPELTGDIVSIHQDLWSTGNY